MKYTNRPLAWAWAVACLTIGCEAASQEASDALRFDFENDAAGQAPLGLHAARSGQGAPARWEVVDANDAPSGGRVVAQLSDDATSYRFPLLIVDEFTATDVDLSVAGKTIAGAKDQAIGLVWRYQNPDNYYVVRANALEGNVVSYKMENGRRSDLDVLGAGDTYGAETKVPRGTWTRLRVVATGDLFCGLSRRQRALSRAGPDLHWPWKGRTLDQGGQRDLVRRHRGEISRSRRGAMIRPIRLALALLLTTFSRLLERPSRRGGDLHVRRPGLLRAGVPFVR